MIAKFIYFKENGKYYTGGEIDVGDYPNYLKEDFKGCIYPKDFGFRAIDLKILPGIAGGIWSGPIMVEAPYPTLILNQNEKVINFLQLIIRVKIKKNYFLVINYKNVKNL